MNCEGFKDNLHEYLDGSLAADLQAEAREHLRQCEDCQRAMQREEAVAENVRHSLQRATERLSLRAGMLANVLRAWESEQAVPNAFARAWQWFMASSLRPVGAGAALLVVLLALLVFPKLRENPAPLGARPSLVIDVPIQMQSRVFHRQDHVVIDAIASSVAIGRANFVENKN